MRNAELYLKWATVKLIYDLKPLAAWRLPETASKVERLDCSHWFYSEHRTEYQSKLSTDHWSGRRWYKIVEMRWPEIASEQTSVSTLRVIVIWAYKAFARLRICLFRCVFCRNLAKLVIIFIFGLFQFTPVVNGEGRSKKLIFFLSSPIVSKHLAFPLIEVSASELSAILKKFEKKRLRTPPYWNCIGSQALFVWRHSVQIGGKEKNRQLSWHSSQSQQNLFFQAIIYFTIFNAIISEFGACLAQNNTTQEQP